MISSFINTMLYRSHPFVMVNIFAGLLSGLLRAYELVSVADAAPEGASFGAIVMSALAADLVWYGVLMAVLTAIYFGVSAFAGDQWAMRVHCSLLSFVLAVTVGVTQYFTVTLLPLGSDLYGYSLQDIVTTVTTSGSAVLLAPLLIAALTAAVFALPRIALRFPAPKPAVLGFYLLAFLSVPASAVVTPDPSDFSSETAYHIAVNKTSSFAVATARVVTDRFFTGAAYSESEYPFLHETTDEDVLGPMLNTSAAPPNIVVIIVEGLGSAFVEGGSYAGFTPFIDSLARTNLYWKHMLSTTGRTFGVLPSLTASLPFGPHGFLELGPSMPDHHSLISILKENGYRTSYFYGGDIGFDRQDIFLERQGTDRIVSAKDFPGTYAKAPATAEGFTWGYADGELFRYALETTGNGRDAPRLDIFMTLSTHEPFIPPQTDRFRAEAERIIAAMPVSGERKQRLRSYRDIFSTLLYTDDAIRTFVTSLLQRPDAARTLVIITGDHRLIPVPMATKIDRYRVPLIIASPMVRSAKTFRSVSTHADVTPTLLGYLRRTYGVKLPLLEHWIGSALDTAEAFRNLRSRAFMPYKGEVSDYLSGEQFLSGDRLFRITPSLDAEEFRDDVLRDRLRLEREEFIRLSRYVVEQNKLMPNDRRTSTDVERRNDDSLFAVIDAWGLNSDALFDRARSAAFSGQYKEARGICRRLLALNAEYHDVRALLASTWAWDKRYSEARKEFSEVIRRAPNYADAYVGLSRVEFWDGNMEAALMHIDKALSILPGEPFARIQKAKVLFALARDREAMRELDAVLSRPSPAADEARTMKEKYSPSALR